MGSDRSLTPSLLSPRPEAMSTKALCNFTRHLAEAGRGLSSCPMVFHFIHGTNGRPRVLTALNERRGIHESACIGTRKLLARRSANRCPRGGAQRSWIAETHPFVSLH